MKYIKGNESHLFAHVGRVLSKSSIFLLIMTALLLISGSYEYIIYEGLLYHSKINLIFFNWNEDQQILLMPSIFKCLCVNFLLELQFYRCITE